MPLPIDRPSTRVLCNQCQGTVPVPQEVWRELLYIVEGGQGPPAGMMQTYTWNAAGLPVTVQVASVLPLCEKCGAPFDESVIPPWLDQNFACPSCGDPASAETAPEWLRQVVSTATQIISVDPRAEAPAGGELAQVDQESAKPVMMSCPQCSASLSITSEHARVTACQYCGTDVFLPDSVWKRLHPVKTVQWFYVRFDGITAERQQERLVEEVRRAKDEILEAEKQQRRQKAQEQVPLAWALAIAYSFGLAVVYLIALAGPLLIRAISGGFFIYFAWVAVALSIPFLILIHRPHTTETGQSALGMIILGGLWGLVPGCGIVLVIVGVVGFLTEPESSSFWRTPRRPFMVALTAYGVAATMLFPFTKVAPALFGW